MDYRQVAWDLLTAKRIAPCGVDPNRPCRWCVADQFGQNSNAFLLSTIVYCERIADCSTVEAVEIAASLALSEASR